MSENLQAEGFLDCMTEEIARVKQADAKKAKSNGQYDLPKDLERRAAPVFSDTLNAKPKIQVVAGARHVAVDEGLAALVKADVPFYQRDRKIQRIALVKAKNTLGEIMWVPGIVPVVSQFMLRQLGLNADWLRYDMKRKKLVPIDPPSEVAGQILSMVGEWPFSPLNGIIQCPTLRRDGSLLDKPGYDEATALYLTNDFKMPQISMRPTREQAKEALSLLSGLLSEFPFVDGESKAVALSMLITPIVRGAMTVAPMHLVVKPAPGTGASYLADCASMIATGERCAVESMAPNYEETEKRLVGAALSGRSIIPLDNCRDIIAGDFFCQIVERALMSLRALGSSEKHLIPNFFTMFANGNNASVADDMVRRTIRCLLDANCENPETRTFKGNPLKIIQSDRGRYVAAALTIPLAYLAAGCPNPCRPLPSFEEWSTMVRSPLVWLGCGDPVKTQDSLRSDDPRKSEKVMIFDAWKRSKIGVGHDRSCTTKELIDSASNDNALCDALLTVAAQRFSAERKIDPKALGKWLSNQQGTIAAGCKLNANRADAARPRWYLEFSKQPEEDTK